MRVVLILLVLVPILLALAQAAPPKSTKPATTTTTGTSPKKGKQLVYYVPGQSRAAAEVVNNLQHDEQDDEEEVEEDADDDVEDEDADDDVDDDDDAFDIPAFDKVFPNPDGRPVGPNSYDAFQRHRPGGSANPVGGPAAHGQAGPRGAGQAGPRVAGQAGPGQRRVEGPYLRTDIQDVPDSEDVNLGLTPPYPGARLLDIIPADDPTDSNDDEPETNSIYPNTRDGRQSYVGRVPMQNYNRYRAPVSRPVIVANRRNYNYNYAPVRRPISALSYNVNNNRRQMMGYPTQYRPVQQSSRPVIYSPVRRNPAVVQVPMSYRPQVVRGPYSHVTPYAVPQVRAGTGRGYNPWSWSPLRGDNYNPEYVVNPTEMLSRRKFRYHPSHTMPVQRIPLHSHGVWGNPKQIQRDPWTGAHYHGGYLSSQI